MPQWIAREFLARRGNAEFSPAQVLPARCDLFGYGLRSLMVEGQTLPEVLLRPELQPEVCERGYDEGAGILRAFFHEQLRTFLVPDLSALGSDIVECCLGNGSLREYEALVPHPMLSPE
jgi:hypothetical protein